MHPENICWDFSLKTSDDFFPPVKEELPIDCRMSEVVVPHASTPSMTSRTDEFTSENLTAGQVTILEE